MTDTKSNLLNAMDCVSRGWLVVPLYTAMGEGCSCSRSFFCGNVGKHPIPPNGLKAGSSSPEDVQRWWGEWRTANIGIVTGAESGVFVLDIDPRHDGDDTLSSLQSRYGKLPDTVETLTGSGGRHIFFRHPGVKVRNDSQGKLFGPGIDVRGDGGYVVGPGSRHANGRLYEWEASSHPDDVEIADAPQWVLDRIIAPVTTQTPAGTNPSETGTADDPSTDKRNLRAAARRYAAKVNGAVQGEGGGRRHVRPRRSPAVVRRQRRTADGGRGDGRPDGRLERPVQPALVVRRAAGQGRQREPQRLAATAEACGRR